MTFGLTCKGDNLRKTEATYDILFNLCRRQFERANLEAMDESAEWRMKYDGEVERSRQLQDELLKVLL